MRGERRRYFRLVLSVAPVWVHRIDARGHVLALIEGHVSEVSGGGLRLRVDAGRLLVGHRLALCFPLADETFELTGHVVWADEESADGAHHVGVGFAEVDAGLRGRIVGAMNEHRRRHEPTSARLVARLR